jgi:hypothetical protein
MPIIPILADGGALIAGLGVTVMIFIIIGIVLSIFWIWMLIDCLMSNLPSTEKLIWFLVVFFLHILGALLYYFIGRPNTTARIA